MADSYRSNTNAEQSPRPLRPPPGRGLGALGMRVLRSLSPRGPWKATPAATTSKAEAPDDGLCLTSRSSSGTPVLPQAEASSRPPVAPARDTWRRPSPRRQAVTPRSSLSRAESTDSKPASESSQWAPSSTSSLPPPGAFIRPGSASESTNGTPRSCYTSRSAQGSNASSGGCESQRRCLSARELSRSDRRDMLCDGSDSDRAQFYSARGHASEKVSSFPRIEAATQHRESAPASSSSEEAVVQDNCLKLLDAVFDFPMANGASKFMLEANPSIAWLGQCLHRCPLPPCWSALESRCGSEALKYVDMSAGIVSDSPPSMQQFVDLVRVMLYCRSNPSQADFVMSRLQVKYREHISDAENARKTWNGPHTDPGTGAEYWHCVSSGQSTWGDPGAADDFLAQVVNKLIQTIPNEISAKTASSRQYSARGTNSQWSTLPQWMQMSSSSMSNTLNSKESTLHDVGLSICQDRAHRTRKDRKRPSSTGALPNDDTQQSWWSSAMSDPFEGGVPQHDVVLRPESRRRRPQSCERLEPISKPQESPRSSTPRSKSKGKDDGVGQNLKREEVMEGYSYIGKYAKEPVKPATEIMQKFQVFEAEAQLKKLPPPPPPPPLLTARRQHIVTDAGKLAAVDSAPPNQASDCTLGDLPETPSTSQGDSNLKSSGSMSKDQDDTPTPKDLSPTCSETPPTDQPITSQGESNLKSSGSMSKGRDDTPSPKDSPPDTFPADQPCDTCVSGNLEEVTSPIHECIDQNDKAANDEQRLEEVTMLNALAQATCSATTCSTEEHMAKCDLADDAICTKSLEGTIISPKNDGVALASDSMVQKLDFAFTGSSSQAIVSSSLNEDSTIHRRPLGNTVEWFEIGTPAHLDKSGALLESLHSTSNAESAMLASSKQAYELSPKACAIDTAVVMNGSEASLELNGKTQESSHSPCATDRELEMDMEHNDKECDSSPSNIVKKEEEEEEKQTKEAEAIANMSEFAQEQISMRINTEVCKHAGESNLESEVIAEANEFTQGDEANVFSRSYCVIEEKHEVAHASETAQEQIDTVDEESPSGCIMEKEITDASEPTQQQNQSVQDMSSSGCQIDQEVIPNGTQLVEEQLHELSQSICAVEQDAVAKDSQMCFEQDRKMQELSTINLEERVVTSISQPNQDPPGLVSELSHSSASVSEQDRVTNVSHLSTTVEASRNVMETDETNVATCRETSQQQDDNAHDLSGSSTIIKKGVQVNVSQAEFENGSDMRICEVVSPNAGSLDSGGHDRTCTSVHTCATERHGEDLAVLEIGVTGQIRDDSRVASGVEKDHAAMVHARRQRLLDEDEETNEQKEENCSDQSIVKPIAGNASSVCVDLSLLERELADESVPELAVESNNSTMLAHKEEPLLADVSVINADLGQTSRHVRAPFDFTIASNAATGFARSRTTWSSTTDSSDKEGVCALSGTGIDLKVECVSVMEEDSPIVVNHTEKMPTQSAYPPPQQSVRESALTWVEAVAYGKKSRDMEVLGDLIWGPAPEFDTSPSDEQGNNAGSVTNEKLPGSTISPTSGTPARPKRPPRKSAYRSTSSAEVEPPLTTFEDSQTVDTNAQAPSSKVSRPRGCTRVVGNRMAPAGGA